MFERFTVLSQLFFYSPLPILCISDTNLHSQSICLLFGICLLLPKALPVSHCEMQY